jgi:SAM-dependent methyltransferase
MERLDIIKPPASQSIEAAIHLARYASAISFVKGKRVLDIACGEGYGSYLLKEAGALSVVGVDILETSISQAKKLFADKNLEYLVADLNKPLSVFKNHEFDIVISAETIEHLLNPEIFLETIKHLIKPDGIIILTCPNDHWYYPFDNKSNPFHIRKYSFGEFQALSTGTLGDNVVWSVGTAVLGFGSVPIDTRDNYLDVPGTWMKYLNVDHSYLVSGKDSAPSISKCSYFVGIWNAPKRTNGLAVFPLNMNQFSTMVEGESLKDELFIARREIRNIALKLSASQYERLLVSEALRASQEIIAIQSVGYHRYLKLKKFVPVPIRIFIRYVYKRLKFK